MQLSFSTLPNDTAGSAALAPAANRDSDGATDGLAAPGAGLGGFAQLLAGIAPAKSAPPSVPAGLPGAPLATVPAAANGGIGVGPDAAPAANPANPDAGSVNPSVVAASGAAPLLTVMFAAMSGNAAPTAVPAALPNPKATPAGAKSEPGKAPAGDRTGTADTSGVQAVVAALFGQAQPLPAPGAIVAPVGTKGGAAEAAAAVPMPGPGADAPGAPVPAAIALASRSGAPGMSGPAAAAGPGRFALAGEKPAAVPAAPISTPATSPSAAAAVAARATTEVTADAGRITAGPNQPAAATAPAISASSVPAAVPDSGDASVALNTPHAASGATPSAAAQAAVAEAPGSAANALRPAGAMMEKIAAAGAQVGPATAAGEKGRGKSFVASDARQLTQSRRILGIGGAEPAPTMPPGSTFARFTLSDATPVTSTAPATEARPQPESLPQPVALTSTAHRAVEAVLSATDRFNARDQHSVNLQFSVAGSDLNVRVELRAGEVHTTFRTDSAELRAALSGEWHTMTAQGSGDRSTRLAPPVFTTSDHAGTSFSGDNASPQHRGTDARGTGENPSNLPVPRRSSAPSGTTATGAPAAPVTRSVAVNSVHLHTLA